jgi:glycine/D-amino acid oxidase-like deaminating enzyme
MDSFHAKIPEIGTLVVGGGIVGTALGGFLAKEGLDVAVVDAGSVGGSTTNAGSLHVQMQSVLFRRFPERIPQVEKSLHLYKLGVAFWHAFQEELGADCEVKMSGGLMIAENQHELGILEKKAKRESELGLDVAILSRAELDRIAPYLGPAVIGAEFCVHEGKVNPLLANAATERWASENGVVQLRNEPVLRLEKARQGFRATTGKGTIMCGRVVLAAGYGSRPLAAQFGYNLPASSDPLHMNITEGTAPLILHLVQHADRPITLKQLSSGQAVIGGGWPAELREPGRIAMTKLSSMIGNLSLAQHIIPQLATLRVMRTWAGVNTGIDGCGVVGPIGHTPGLYFAIPGYAGYTLGPITARLTADCILGRSPGANISMYSPARFGG